MCSNERYVFQVGLKKNLPINVEDTKNHAIFSEPRGLVVSIAAFHPDDPCLIPGQNIIIC